VELLTLLGVVSDLDKAEDVESFKDRLADGNGCEITTEIIEN